MTWPTPRSSNQLAACGDTGDLEWSAGAAATSGSTLPQALLNVGLMDRVVLRQAASRGATRAPAYACRRPTGRDVVSINPASRLA
jgi:hypothetical protein